MSDMTAAQSAQQNNRDGAGKYATKAVDESGVELGGAQAAPANLTLKQWEKKVFASLTAEDKDKIARFATAHAVYLASKAEWSSDDNFAFTEGMVEKFKHLTEMPPEGMECETCGVVFDPDTEEPLDPDAEHCGLHREDEDYEDA